jgi:hypothetical protein
MDEMSYIIREKTKAYTTFKDGKIAIPDNQQSSVGKAIIDVSVSNLTPLKIAKFLIVCRGSSSTLICRFCALSVTGSDYCPNFRLLSQLELSCVLTRAAMKYAH